MFRQSIQLIICGFYFIWKRCFIPKGCGRSLANNSRLSLWQTLWFCDVPVRYCPFRQRERSAKHKCHCKSTLSGLLIQPVIPMERHIKSRQYVRGGVVNNSWYFLKHVPFTWNVKKMVYSKYAPALGYTFSYLSGNFCNI